MEKILIELIFMWSLEAITILGRVLIKKLQDKATNKDKARRANKVSEGWIKEITAHKLSTKNKGDLKKIFGAKKPKEIGIPRKITR